MKTYCINCQEEVEMEVNWVDYLKEEVRFEGKCMECMQNLNRIVFVMP